MLYFPQSNVYHNLRSSLFWGVMQHILEFSYWRFVTACWYYPQGSSSRRRLRCLTSQKSEISYCGRSLKWRIVSDKMDSLHRRGYRSWSLIWEPLISLLTRFEVSDVFLIRIPNIFFLFLWRNLFSSSCLFRHLSKQSTFSAQLGSLRRCWNPISISHYFTSFPQYLMDNTQCEIWLIGLPIPTV